MAIDQNQNQNLKNRNVDTSKVDNRNTATHKVGDAIEKAGQKIKDMGAEKLGNAVYKAGNKIEHSGENK